MFHQSANECSNTTRCLRCLKKHKVKELTARKNISCSNCGCAQSTVYIDYSGCPVYLENIAVASKEINENKYSAAANKPQTNSILPTSIKKTDVLVADGLTRIHDVLRVFITISYKNLLSFFSNSASLIFNKKNDANSVRESVKKANTVTIRPIQSNSLTNSQNFSQHENSLKILQ